MTRYPALIHKDEGTDYGVSFPDFPGCVSAGRTLDDVMTMAAEALELCIDDMRDHNENIPAPSPLEAIVADPENRDALAVVYIDVPAAAPRAVRVNITLPEDVLRRIDAYAERHGYTRSGFIAHAAKRMIKAA